MTYSIADLAGALGATFSGDGTVLVSGVAQPDVAGETDLALAMDPKFATSITSGSAQAAVLWEGADPSEFELKAAIFAPRSRYALAGLTTKFYEPPALNDGIHETALIDPTAEVSSDARIGPFTVIGPNVRIGPGARIYAHVAIADNSIIGRDALIYSGVRIGQNVKIGDRFVAQIGAAIGADGFSYVTPKPNSVEEAREQGLVSSETQNNAFVRIESLAGVTLGDDVEFGANSTIDRGTLIDTTIGRGTKVDNLVQIGHNVQIGEDCLLCGQAGIAGSAKLGDRIVLGGKAGVADHITIGSDVVVAGASALSSNVPSGRIMMGNPAMRMDLNVESYKALRRLPRLLKKLSKG